MKRRTFLTVSLTVLPVLMAMKEMGVVGYLSRISAGIRRSFRSVGFASRIGLV